MISQILLDLDGVLCDFVLPAVRLFTDSPQEICANWTPGNYAMGKALGVTENKFWKTVDKAGRFFWANLPPYPWMTELFELCQSTAPTIICTSPSLHCGSVTGKMMFIQQHFGYTFRDYMIGPRKHFGARPGSVLIDDSDINCALFRQHGGQAILFPQIWNELHAQANDPMKVVREELALLAGAELPETAVSA